MIRLFFTTVILLFIFPSAAFSQEKRIRSKKVLPTIKTYVHTHYPDASKIKYYQETKKDKLITEVNFEYKKEAYSLVFLPDGTFIEQEKKVDFENVSSEAKNNITNYLSTNYPNYKMLDCQEASTPSTVTKVYEINIKNAGNFYELFFDTKGQFTNYNELVIPSIITQF